MCDELHDMTALPPWTHTPAGWAPEPIENAVAIRYSPSSAWNQTPVDKPVAFILIGACLFEQYLLEVLYSYIMILVRT
jgi:hypothetical protein